MNKSFARTQLSLIVTVSPACGVWQRCPPGVSGPSLAIGPIYVNFRRHFRFHHPLCCTVLIDGRPDWMQKSELPETWLRGTMTAVPAVHRAVLHALELAREDLERWCDG